MKAMDPEPQQLPTYPFPGMDPYLEHPVLWEGVHARLIVAMANQIQPQLDPRYVTSIEERVFIEGPQRRIPDLWIQKVSQVEAAKPSPSRSSGAAVILEVDDAEVRESRIEILDAYNDLKLVAVLEIVSPTNKVAGPGRDSYLSKQSEILSRECHFIEVDLLRHGQHVISIPEWRVQELRPYDYLSCVSRWPHRKRYEVYSCRLQDRLPRVMVPLAEPDPDVELDVQAALEQVHSEGRYAWRVRYGEPCVPPLSAADQAWARERLAASRPAPM